MDQNQLCDRIEALAPEFWGDKLPIKLQRGEKKILEQVPDFDLFLRKTQSSYYPIHKALACLSEAFNIEVIRNIKRMPKLPAYYESLAGYNRTLKSLQNIVGALEAKFGPVPKEKLSVMLCSLYSEGDRHLKAIAWLQSKGADIDYTGSRKGSESVLMVWSRCGHAKTVRKLLQMGADPNVKLSSGGTALLFCAGKEFPSGSYRLWNYEERLKSMRLLLEYGAKTVTGRKPADDVRYFLSRTSGGDYVGRKKFNIKAMALIEEFHGS